MKKKKGGGEVVPVAHCIVLSLFTINHHSDSRGGGYNAARWHRAFRGEGWKAPGLLVAFGFPGLFFAFFIGFNSCLSSLQSSGAVPFLTLIAIVFVWFGVSAPLAVLGSYLGIKVRRRRRKRRRIYYTIALCFLYYTWSCWVIKDHA